MFELETYKCRAGKFILTKWVSPLRDSHARARIDVRLNRLAGGLYGDARVVGEGVMKLKIDWGPGYRVYFARDGARVILLLCGGDKRTQQRDISNAIEYWKDYQARGE